MSLATIAFEYLKACDVEVSKNFLEQRIICHPNYPALISFTDTLDQFGLEYKAVEAEEKHISSFSFPFLAHTPKAVGEFEIVPSIDYYKNNRQTFLNRWEGVAIMVKTKQLVNNDDHEAFLRKESKANSTAKWSIGVGLIIFALIFLINFNLLIFLFSLLSLAGISICTLIILHKMGKGNAITRQLCSTGKTHSCDLVLNSKASQIIKNVDFGDAGLIYFSSVLLFTYVELLASREAETLTSLIIPGFLALCFTFYSIIYQWKIVKAWCKMCLITISILWLQSIIICFHLFWAKEIVLKSPISTILVSIFCLSLASIWLLVKPLIQKREDGKETETTLLKWKRNPEIFRSLLLKQPYTETTIPNNPFRFGKADAKLRITIVSNLFCGPCAIAHKQMETLYERYPDLLSVEVNFAFESASDNEDRRTVAVQHILEAFFANENPLIVLHDWFQTMDIHQFDGKYGSGKWNNEALGRMKNYEYWLSMNTIPYTPYIYLNGHPLPEQYGLNDMEPLLIDLSELLLQPFSKDKHNEKVSDFSWQ